MTKYSMINELNEGTEPEDSVFGRYRNTPKEPETYEDKLLAFERNNWLRLQRRNEFEDIIQKRLKFLTSKEILSDNVTTANLVNYTTLNNIFDILETSSFPKMYKKLLNKYFRKDVPKDYLKKILQSMEEAQRGVDRNVIRGYGTDQTLWRQKIVQNAITEIMTTHHDYSDVPDPRILLPNGEVIPNPYFNCRGGQDGFTQYSGNPATFKWQGKDVYHFDDFVLIVKMLKLPLPIQMYSCYPNNKVSFTLSRPDYYIENDDRSAILYKVNGAATPWVCIKGKKLLFDTRTTTPLIRVILSHFI